MSLAQLYAPIIERDMQRFLIILVNCALLALVCLGIPAATRAEVGNWHIARTATTQLLILWGLGAAAVLNILAALFLIKGRKEKIQGWEWAGVFAVLGLLQYAINRGWVNFMWLKLTLQWFQAHL